MKKILLLKLFVLFLIVNPVGSRTDISHFSRCAEGWRWRSTSGQIQLQFSDDGSRISMIQQAVPELTAETFQHPTPLQVPDNRQQNDQTLQRAIVFGNQQRTLPDPESLNLRQPEPLNDRINRIQRQQLPPPQQQIQIRLRPQTQTLVNDLRQTLLLLSAGTPPPCSDKAVTLVSRLSDNQ